ncbi:MAG: glycerol-3-phosphate 1-O-acyltransferase PlsY [Tenuifilaceae bacterium]
MEDYYKVLIILLAYLIGSIPTSVWVGKIFYGIDVRDYGSGNAGATNAMRTLGAKAGIIVFIIDMLKGYLAVRLLFLTNFYIPETGMFVNFQLYLGLAAMLGHVFPIFAGFRGGKGVATLSGVVFALHPYGALFVFLIWFVTLLIFGYVSLSSMIAGFSFPIILIFVWRTEYPELVIFAFILAVLMLFTHQKNIERLYHGTEKKIKILKKKEPPKEIV